MELKPYHHQRGFAFLETLPKHPFIPKKIMETFSVRIKDIRNGQARLAQAMSLLPSNGIEKERDRATHPSISHNFTPYRL